MAKKKRRQSKPKKRAALSKRLTDQLRKVEDHLRRKHWPEAAELLENVGREHPRNEDILALP